MDSKEDAAVEQPFAMVANVLDVKCALPAELSPGHALRRATQAEIKRIREFGRMFGSFHGNVFRRFEMDFSFKETATGRRVGSQPLPAAQWRYFVIEMPLTGQGRKALRLLEQAARLSPIELECPVSFYPGGASVGTISPEELSSFSIIASGVGAEPLDEKVVTAIRENVNAIRDNTNADVARAVEMLHRLKSVKDHEELYLIGLCVILELLLTHDPARGEPGLSHQISHKIPLLDRRMRERLDYSCFVPGTTPQKVWLTLYKCRSSLAHGGSPDFRGSLQCIRDMATASAFLERAVKSVVRHALDESELVMDLRAC